MDAKIEQLPESFTAVELMAVQIGAGLTGVVARFNVASAASSSLDEVWHSDHEPRLKRERGRIQLRRHGPGRRLCQLARAAHRTRNRR
jgi:ribosomal protein L3